MQTPAPASASVRRRLQQREEARRAILDATEALLVEGGYEGFSMRRLADRCGYTPPTLYHHFGDKQHLLDAVLEERLARVLARLRRVERRDEPLETLRAMVLEFVRFGIENPDHYRLFTLRRPGAEPPPRSGEEIRELFEGPLGELARDGRLAAGDGEVAKQFLWSVLHGVVSLRIDRLDQEWAPDLVEFSVDAALRGLVASAGPNGRSGEVSP